MANEAEFSEGNAVPSGLHECLRRIGELRAMPSICLGVVSRGGGGGVFGKGCSILSGVAPLWAMPVWRVCYPLTRRRAGGVSLAPAASGVSRAVMAKSGDGGTGAAIAASA